MFVDSSKFKFTETLEANWQLIHRELLQIPQGSFVAWPERFLYEEGWNVFGLYGFGRKLEKNCALCPHTTSVVESIPGLTTAGFSWLEPGTHIKPHVGYSGAVLRCHLGLAVPAGCTLRVGAEKRGWSEGKCLVFDDTTEHEAWNESDRARVVLLVDFLKDGAVFQPPDIAREMTGRV
jgi:beta-hydroxylase